MFNLLANPAVIKAATELLETAFEGTEEEKGDKVKEVIKKYSVPIWKQKKFYALIMTVAGFLLDHYLGIDIQEVFYLNP